MPNCDFFATPDDHKGILEWLFAEGTCHVHELASAFGERLTRFESVDEVMARFHRTRAVYLQLEVLGAGPKFRARRIKLDPKRCGGATFRYEAEGWGLVQLYLENARRGRLDLSHTNHNSATRAGVWSPTVPELGSPAAWDFKRINAFSARLNREIRKRAVAKVWTRVVLPGALEQWKRGVQLGPFEKKHLQLL